MFAVIGGWGDRVDSARVIETPLLIVTNRVVDLWAGWRESQFDALATVTITVEETM